MGQHGSEAPESETLTEKAHAELKNNILHGHHQPGEPLRIEHLKRDYGVSGGTLREALRMLIADGLVVAEAQRGFRVKPVSAEDLIDLNRIRILLEKEAIRQSIACGGEEWEAKVVSSFHFLSGAMKALVKNPSDQVAFEEWERRHRAFHLALFSAASSELTLGFLNVTYEQYERYRHMFQILAQGIDRTRDVDAEHTAILDAVLARDADTAAALLEQHLLRTLDEWIEFFEKTGVFGPEKTIPRSARGSKPRARSVQ